ncbi:lysozyme g-like [Trematomus bernacchii]|uniref:lysozyme g-like n=1 Tax=Trematomus bernacchii TaxID=40690 RepID=UPI00146ACD69|nr:lysozyme g-like [Trematomus bernacchii]
MAPKTVTQALKNMLDNLYKEQLEEFSSALLDRKEEPRVKRKDLEDKSRVAVAEVLVATYTESRAIQVALDILKEIKCNEQREILAKEASEVSSTKETQEGSLPLVYSHFNIMLVETTGASMATAQQDKLKYQGINASNAMAEIDLEDMEKYKSIIKEVACEKKVDPALIAAIISRQSRAGKTLNKGWGCPNTFGLMQILMTSDRCGHIGTDLWASKEHICEGTKILIQFLLRIKHTFPDWSKEQQLKGGIAAYNAGDGNIHSHETVDSKTSNGDFSNDVIARAQWYRTDGGF